MLSSLFLAAIAPQTLPAVDGTRINAGEACYAIVAGGQPIGATLQSVTAGKVEGVAVWQVRVHQRVNGGQFEMRDDFVVRRADLRPLSLHSVTGEPGDRNWRDIQLTYSDNSVRGMRTTIGGALPIAADFTGPIWEGNLWGLTFAALPLAEGANFELPNWQYDKGPGTFIARVSGTQTAVTPGGEIEAWSVEAGTDPAQLFTYQFAKSDNIELGYSSARGGQRLGGDCSEMGG